MAEFTAIEFDVDGRDVATITLALPDKHNVMGAAMIADLTEATRLIGERSARVCVLAAKGKSFCAGGDLSWMQQQMTADREGKMAQAGALAAALTALDDLPCPLIGRVHGPAYGGGLGLISVCDFVVASTEAKFAFTETKLGLIPATIGPFVIRRIGEAFARQFFFSTKPFDAAEARAMNLASAIGEPGRLDGLVEAEVERYLQCRPGAVADGKALAKQLARNPAMDSAAYTAGKLADRWETDEAKQAIEAFFAARQKR